MSVALPRCQEKTWQKERERPEMVVQDGSWIAKLLSAIESVVSAIEAGVESLPEFERLLVRLAVIVFRCTIYGLGVVSLAKLLFRMVKVVGGS